MTAAAHSEQQHGMAQGLAIPKQSTHFALAAQKRSWHADWAVLEGEEELV